MRVPRRIYDFTAHSSQWLNPEAKNCIDTWRHALTKLRYLHVTDGEGTCDCTMGYVSVR